MTSGCPGARAAYAGGSAAATGSSEKGDFGCIPQGYGHSIENVGSGPERILIGFNAGIYETISRNGSRQIRIATNFGQPAEVFAKFPDRDAFIAGKDATG